ncbi:hypothetical protein [Methylobacterium sp.]|uniref:hypothetical protein n=1 Tax=Methylobacterium sp. TaxID=409 RepID=UPI0025F4FA0D|nr:hypothetical protein [Methylobacterium sp.]MBY0257745.1 hypothetical protein [Methylobacterium sp.]
MDRPASVILAAAYHEAGHAVASWRQGDGIAGITIIPGVDPRTGRPHGGVFTLPKGGDRSALSGWGHRYLVTTLAGPASQRKHDPRSNVLSCAGQDFSDARMFAAAMARSRESERALLMWAQAEARALIAANWHLIDILARSLFRVRQIEGASAIAILEAVERAEAETERILFLRRAKGARPFQGAPFE